MLLSLLGCLAPTMQAAHSLDAGQIEVGLGAQIAYTDAATTFYGTDDDYALHESGFAIPDPGDLAPEFRVGLGGGFEVASRGIPFIGVTQVKYAILDERRHRTPLSLAVAGEMTMDIYRQPLVAARAGLLLSSTIPVGEAFAVRPAVAAWYGGTGSSYHFDLPADAADADATVAPRLTLSYADEGVMIPAGVELPIRAGSLAVTPYLAATVLIPVRQQLVDADAIGATGTIGELDASLSAYAQLGVRLAPWFVPARSKP